MSETRIEHYSGGLTLIGSLEPIECGDTFTDWPLHATVLPRFSSTKASKEAIDTAIQQQVDLFHHLELVGIRFDKFGRKKDIPVCVVRSDGLVTLHNDLLEAMKLFLPKEYLSNEYIGDGYEPHVSDTESNFLEVGDTAVLNSLHLIARNRDPAGGHIKTVVQKYPFKVLQ